VTKRASMTSQDETLVRLRHYHLSQPCCLLSRSFERDSAGGESAIQVYGIRFCRAPNRNP